MMKVNAVVKVVVWLVVMLWYIYLSAGFCEHIFSVSILCPKKVTH